MECMRYTLCTVRVCSAVAALCTAHAVQAHAPHMARIVSACACCTACGVCGAAAQQCALHVQHTEYMRAAGAVCPSPRAPGAPHAPRIHPPARTPAPHPLPGRPLPRHAPALPPTTAVERRDRRGHLWRRAPVSRRQAQQNRNALRVAAPPSVCWLTGQSDRRPWVAVGGRRYRAGTGAGLSNRQGQAGRHPVRTGGPVHTVPGREQRGPHGRCGGTELPAAHSPVGRGQTGMRKPGGIRGCCASAALETRGIETQNRVFVSDRAHLVLDYHCEADRLRERELGEHSIGTTGKGIGPAYSSKAERSGIRVHHLYVFGDFERLLRQNVEWHERRYGRCGGVCDVDAELDRYRVSVSGQRVAGLGQGRGWTGTGLVVFVGLGWNRVRVGGRGWLAGAEGGLTAQGYAERLRPYVVDAVYFMQQAIRAEKRILVEGANALMLDIDYGTYPYVTSSNTSIGGVCTGLGLSPRQIEHVIGVVKAYTTRVGYGPFPTELQDETGEHLQREGREWGVTTGRRRRCGWLDLVLLRYSGWINGYSGYMGCLWGDCVWSDRNSLMVTKLDVLDGLAEIKVGVAYKKEGEEVPYVPADLETLKSVQVEYKTLPGWQRTTRGCRAFGELPLEAQAYIRFIEDFVDVKVDVWAWLSVAVLCLACYAANIRAMNMCRCVVVARRSFLILSRRQKQAFCREELGDKFKDLLSADKRDFMDSIEDRNNATESQNVSEISEILDPVSSEPFKQMLELRENKDSENNETFILWQSATLGKILQVTLDEKTYLKTPDYMFLSALRQELIDESLEPVISVDTLDRVILTRLSMASPSKPFDYLISCWKRSVAMEKVIRKSVDAEAKMDVIKEAKRLFVSYSGLSITFPEMFEHQQPPIDFATKLLEELDSSDGIPFDFIKALVYQFDEEGTLADLFGETVLELSNRLSQKTILDNYQPYIKVLNQLVTLKPFTLMITHLPRWLPENSTAADIEYTSILGPYLRLTPMQAKISELYFSNASKRFQADISGSINSLRLTMRTLQNQLFYIVNTIIRTSAECKEKMLEYFAKVLELNKRRKALHVDPKTISTDGYIVNITNIMNTFSEPFIDIDKIDINYFKKKPKIDIMKETKLNADEKVSEIFYKDKIDGLTNFISEIFFLNVAYHYYGLSTAMHNHEHLMKMINDLQKQYDVLESQKSEWAKVRLPLPQNVSDHMRNLPETILSNSIRHNPELIISNSAVELVVFIITFLKNSSYIKNPYLKAKLAEILFYGTLKQHNYFYGILGDILNSNTFSLHHLLPALMSFYVEVESTGLSSQFYDKFNIRYQISQVFKAIWENPGHREKLLLESRNNFNFFVKFVALLLNDATYLLDEALSKLLEIHNLQLELDNVPKNIPLNDERQDKRHYLIQLEKYATTYMSLAVETIELLKRFTASIPDAFCCPEVVDRLAAMLDYNINALVGPKCSKLKVRNPEKYRFEPKSLLSNIADIYLNLRSKKSFVAAIAKDGRSYKKDLFFRATQIFKKYSTKSLDDIDNLLALIDEVEEVKKKEEDNEEFGEIPEEFLDPIMACLMTDPVILPSSRVTVDMATIKSHLLSEENDPFNRSPLKLEDLIPNNELKARLETFKAERMAKKKSKANKDDILLIN
ncbi:hypothetical protein PMAC_002238 [Pneumocystis sp. 'macacae']|nr:hypothetical protein PMAC_002238 [Pneumocystis sp. 'macacae']